MSAHSVSPPAGGTTCADSTDAFAASGMYELSVCQPSLPRSDLKRCSSGAMTVPSGFWLLIATAFCSGSAANSSISPKRLANAICSASVRCWPGKTSTACAWKASSTVFQAASSIRASTTSVTTAPRVAAIGEMVGVIGVLLGLAACVPAQGGVKRERSRQGERDDLLLDAGSADRERDVLLAAGH